MSQHTKEPWSVGPQVAQMVISPAEQVIIVEPFGLSDGKFVLPHDVREANARRIVACVNACKGLATETLEQSIPNIHGRLALLRQRDELLEALDMIMHATAPTHQDGAFHENAYDLAEAAVEKVRGGL